MAEKSTERVKKWRRENRARDNAVALARYHAQSSGERAKRLARAAVYEAKKAGRLSAPGKCQKCGKAGKTHAHHPDHSKRTSVQWLCPSCNNNVKGER